VKARQGISINLLTIRRPDIIGWSDACPFGMGGYNTNSPVFGESRVNNILEYIAMTVNAIVSARDANKNVAPCVLALGDNTSAIGWLYRSSRLHKPHHSIHLKVARHLAHEIINTNCCLCSQHIAGSHNVVADLLSYDGGGRDKPHPIAYDKPNDAILTSRFHSSYATQITANFTISPLPPDIDSWLQQTMQTLESFVTDALSKPLSQKTELGDAGRGTVENLDASMTPHWTECRPQPATLSEKPLSNDSDIQPGTPKGMPSLIATVRARYYQGLSDKPSASWQRRVGSVAGRAPSSTRVHPTPSFPISSTSYTRSPNGILRRRNNAPSLPNF
jgi:hypothetical protein